MNATSLAGKSLFPTDIRDNNDNNRREDDHDQQTYDAQR